MHFRHFTDVFAADSFFLRLIELFCNFVGNDRVMSKKEALQLFGDKKIRTAWSEEEERWFFSIVDVVAVLTNSTDSAAYWKKL